MTTKSELFTKIDQITVQPAALSPLFAFLEARQPFPAQWGSDSAALSRVLELIRSLHGEELDESISLDEAKARLGVDLVAEYAVVTEFIHWLFGWIPKASDKLREILLHSFSVGLGARCVGKELGLSLPSMALSAGFFHDIGRIVMEGALRIDKDSMIERAYQDQIPIDQAEQVLFQTNHMEIGVYVLQKWHFPEAIIQVVRYHHQPEACPAPNPLVDIVHVADAISLMLGIGIGSEGMNYIASAEVKDRLHIKRNQLEVIASTLFLEMEKLNSYPMGMRG
ncbi:MAG: HDOD domain-containing protein [bacterium]|jgi:putative nucleotidyltransferase with HDIG domain|nr:HDOD domain-containing protein [bacterium]